MRSLRPLRCRSFVPLALGIASIAGGFVAAADVPTAAQTALLKTFDAEFVAITPGKGNFPKSFRMGAADETAAEKPVREVTLGRDFAITKYEVPQNLWEAVMGANPSRWKGPRNSVEWLTWDEAVEFCRRATGLMRAAKLIAGNEEIRLPTEAEWEYCCRAGTTTRYSFGDAARKPDEPDKKASLLDPYGWHTGNAAGNDPPVGALKPNAWGLYDMHGYLREFVADAWHPDHADAPTDGRARVSDAPDAKRVVRSGSWKDRYDRLTSAAREPVDRRTKDDAIGLRCVKAAVPANSP